MWPRGGVHSNCMATSGWGACSKAFLEQTCCIGMLNVWELHCLRQKGHRLPEFLQVAMRSFIGHQSRRWRYKHTYFFSHCRDLPQFCPCLSRPNPALLCIGIDLESLHHEGLRQCVCCGGVKAPAPFDCWAPCQFSQKLRASELTGQTLPANERQTRPKRHWGFS